jgi:hypothetical protein
MGGNHRTHLVRGYHVRRDLAATSQDVDRYIAVELGQSRSRHFGTGLANVCFTEEELAGVS